MSIPVTCNACFQSFQIKDEFAGRTVRCKECGAPMVVASDRRAGREGQVSRRRQRRRAKRRGSGAKIVAIAIGIVFGVALVAVGVWFIVDLARDDAQHTVAGSPTGGGAEQRTGTAVSGRSDNQAGGDGRPGGSQPNWVADAQLVPELGKDVTYGQYALRLPKADRVSLRNTRATNDYWLFKGGKFTGMVKVRVTRIDDRERAIRGLQRAAEKRPEVQLATGRLNGHVCIRWTWQQAHPNGSTQYLRAYHSIIGNDWVNCGFISETPPGTRNYKVLETAVRTIRKR